MVGTQKDGQTFEGLRAAPSRTTRKPNELNFGTVKRGSEQGEGHLHYGSWMEQILNTYFPHKCEVTRCPPTHMPQKINSADQKK